MARPGRNSVVGPWPARAGLWGVTLLLVLYPVFLDGRASAQENQKKTQTRTWAGQIFLVTPPSSGVLRGLVAVDPNDFTWRKVVEEAAGRVRVSPDGRRVALPVGKRGSRPEGIWLLDADGEGEPKRIFQQSGTVCWTADGQRLLVSVDQTKDPAKTETWEVRVDGSSRAKSPISETEHVVDASADGRWLLAYSARPPLDQGVSAQLFLQQPVVIMHPDGQGFAVVIPGDPAAAPGAAGGSLTITINPRFSPDSRRIAYVRTRSPRGTEGDDQQYASELAIIDIDGRNRRVLLKGNAAVRLMSVAWSRDGTSLAVSSREIRREEKITESSSKLQVVDLSGVVVRDIPLPESPVTAVLDWR